MFEDWKRLFGSKLKERQALDVRTTELWAIALQGLKITPSEFRTALAKSITLEWPPTAPADFVKLARGDQQSEYPDIRQAYFDAANQNYTHDVVFEAAKRVGFWELKSQAELITYKRWQQIYPSVCSEHQSGAVFRLPESQQLKDESNKHQPASPDFVANLLKQYRAGGASA